MEMKCPGGRLSITVLAALSPQPLQHQQQQQPSLSDSWGQPSWLPPPGYATTVTTIPQPPRGAPTPSHTPLALAGPARPTWASIFLQKRGGQQPWGLP